MGKIIKGFIINVVAATNLGLAVYGQEPPQHTVPPTDQKLTCKTLNVSTRAGDDNLTDYFQIMLDYWHTIDADLKNQGKSALSDIMTHDLSHIMNLEVMLICLLHPEEDVIDVSSYIYGATFEERFGKKITE